MAGLYSERDIYKPEAPFCHGRARLRCLQSFIIYILLVAAITCLTPLKTPRIPFKQCVDLSNTARNTQSENSLSLFKIGKKTRFVLVFKLRLGWKCSKKVLENTDFSAIYSGNLVSNGEIYLGKPTLITETRFLVYKTVQLKSAYWTNCNLVT